MTPETRVTDLFSALSDPTRLQLIHILSSGQEQTVQELVALLGKNQTAVSQHLSTLRRHDIVTFRKYEQTRIYRITNPAWLWWLAGLERSWLAGLDGSHFRVDVPQPEIHASAPGWVAINRPNVVTRSA
jgi:DNA-binding transcriptional ArsR family regulator